MLKAKFITFEGGEGCGKTTQSKLLYQAFLKENLNCFHTREPGGTKEAESIRELLLAGEANKWDKVSEILLHMAARNEHLVKVIKPKLVAGHYVICDRFIDSTLAYQGYGHDLGQPIIKMLHNLAIGDFYPDLTFILDMPVEKSLKRARARTIGADRYENMDYNFHYKVRQGFQEIAKADPSRCIIIDANQPLKKIHKLIIDTVNNKFGANLKA
jgi:dTMP kinase